MAKEHDRNRAAYDKQLDKGFGKMDEALTILKQFGEREKKSPAEFEKARKKSRKLMDAGSKLVFGAIRKNAPHSARRSGALDALDNLNSDEVTARIVEVAKAERPGRLRQWLLASLIGKKSAAAGALMVALCSDPDPRMRAVAVNALAEQTSIPGAVGALEKAAADPVWQVRAGAHVGLYLAKRDAALAKARDAAKGQERGMIEIYLSQLGKGPMPRGFDPVTFGFPVASERVRFVVDFSESMKKYAPQVREEIGKAIDALPNGAHVQIVLLVGSKVVTPGKDAIVLRAETRNKIKDWLAGRQPGGRASSLRASQLLTPAYDHPKKGKKVFEQMPDSIYLVLGPDKRMNSKRPLAGFDRWSDICPATLYIRLFAKEASAELTKLADDLAVDLIAG
ncbi:MAG: HEAT repeat domain-containing protein [Planctomycetota bacterium]